MGHPYEIISVRRAKRPPGAAGANWHRYVIAYKGTNTIQGCRQGDLKAVTMKVEEIIVKLNERHRVPRYAVRSHGRTNPVLKKKTRK